MAKPKKAKKFTKSEVTYKKSIVHEEVERMMYLLGFILIVGVAADFLF